MNLADVFIYLFAILGFVVVFISYWLMAAGLFPRFVERSAERFGSVPVKATFVGLLGAVPLVGAGLALANLASNGVLKLVGVLVAMLPLVLALFGSAGLALRIGQGLPSANDAGEPWRRTLRGSVVLSLSFVLPIIGWFGVLPYAFVTGFGVFLLCVFRKSPPRVPGLLPVTP